MTPRSSCLGEERSPLQGAVHLRLKPKPHCNGKPRQESCGPGCPGGWSRPTTHWVIFGKQRWVTSRKRRRPDQECPVRAVQNRNEGQKEAAGETSRAR